MQRGEAKKVRRSEKRALAGEDAQLPNNVKNPPREVKHIIRIGYINRRGDARTDCTVAHTLDYTTLHSLTLHYRLLDLITLEYNSLPYLVLSCSCG